jgi:hypothetical protein
VSGLLVRVQSARRQHGQLRPKNKRNIMENKYEQFVHDAAAFLRFALETKNPMPDARILGTLIHDITGLDRNEPCFEPRVTGYAESEARR